MVCQSAVPIIEAEDVRLMKFLLLWADRFFRLHDRSYIDRCIANRAVDRSKCLKSHHVSHGCLQRVPDARQRGRATYFCAVTTLTFGRTSRSRSMIRKLGPGCVNARSRTSLMVSRFSILSARATKPSGMPRMFSWIIKIDADQALVSIVVPMARHQRSLSNRYS